MTDEAAALPTADEFAAKLSATPAATATPTETETERRETMDTGATAPAAGTGDGDARNDGASDARNPAAATTPRTFKVSRRGETIEIPEDEVEEYLSLGVDYGMKSRELAERARLIEAAQAQVAERLAALEDLEARLAGRRREESDGSTDAIGDDAVDPELRRAIDPLLREVRGALDELRSQVDEVRGWRDQYLQARHMIAAEETIRDAVDDVRKQFPEVDEQDLHAAVLGRIPDDATPETIRTLYRVVARERADHLKGLRQRWIDEAMKAKAAPPAGAGGGATPVPPKIPEGASLEEASRVFRNLLVGQS